MKKSVYLELADNMLGRLNPATIKRINKFLKNPTTAGWEDIHCIIIDSSGQMKTIWNAVRDILPFFPAWGRKTDYYGNVIRDWEQVPTPEEVIKAINTAVLNKELKTHLN